MKVLIFTLITGRPLTLFFGSGGVGVFPINRGDGTSYTHCRRGACQWWVGCGRVL